MSVQMAVQVPSEARRMSLSRMTAVSPGRKLVAALPARSLNSTVLSSISACGTEGRLASDPDDASSRPAMAKAVDMAASTRSMGQSWR